ncbi:MAG: rod shape-determining protein MreC [Frankiaceae bacterium]|jgi:rod shape-determining protein MreC|nr:rod shape-determining protein MreC [Frankiaceae bacterium]
MLFSLLIVTSLVLLTVDYQGNASSPLRPLERGVAVVVGPAQRAIGHGMTSVTGGIHFGTSQDKQIADLEAQNAALRNQLATTDQMRNELQQLKDLSGLADKWKITPGRVIGQGTATTDEFTLLLDIGSADGVTTESTVITSTGVVGAALLGKIVTVHSHDSTVRLLNSATIGVAVNLARNGEPGFVLGEGNQPMRLTLDSATADMRVGDVIVTRGSTAQRPFYAGIAVGVISRISASPGSSFRVADVTPFGTAGTLEYVGVIVGPGPAVPRRPFPAPSGVPTTVPVPSSGGSSPSPSQPPATTPASSSTAPSPGTSSSPQAGGH